MRASEGVIALAVFLATATAVAEPPEQVVAFGEGDDLPRIALEDQHGRPGAVDASVRLVLFSRDMDGGDFIKQALADDGARLLNESGAVYVADISGMPGLVSRLFALPAMRRRGYPMLLDRDGEATLRLPDTEGRATLIFLDGLRITRVVAADSAEKVLDELRRSPSRAE